MKLRGLIVLGIVLAFGAVKAADDADKDKEKLQGAWQPTAVIEKGEEQAGDKLKDRKVTFKGDKILHKEGDKEQELPYKIDPTQKPKTIDVTVTKDGQEKTIKGIYELKDDELKVCLDVEGGDRPSKFESPSGSNLVLVTLKRIKE